MKRLIPLATAAALLASAPAASAALEPGGTTQLTLDKGTAKALRSLHISVTPTGRASANGTRVRFPITGGRIDPASAAGRIAHRGGLRLRSGRSSIVLRDYVVTVGKRIRLSARVGRARVAILDLTGTPRVTRAGFNANVSGLTARLTGAAAKALNATFGVQAFKKGVTLGKVRVAGRFTATELLATGQTALTIDPGTLQALASLGVAPGVIAPATLTGTVAGFPITGGKVMLNLSSGVVGHAGGLSLTKGATVVRLTDFDIRVGGGPQLLAAVNGGAAKVAIADLDLTGVTPALSGRTVTLPGVTVKLTQAAADALNAAFSTTAFTAGLVLGKATVEATGK